jgi:hypothetical protein
MQMHTAMTAIGGILFVLGVSLNIIVLIMLFRKTITITRKEQNDILLLILIGVLLQIIGSVIRSMIAG